MQITSLPIKLNNRIFAVLTSAAIEMKGTVILSQFKSIAKPIIFQGSLKNAKSSFPATNFHLICKNKVCGEYPCHLTLPLAC